MSRKKSEFEKFLGRELYRAVATRTQTLDFEIFKLHNEPEYDDIEEILNVPYINHQETPLAMDIFKPKDSGDKELPVIVTIHGGGLTMGDRKISRPFGRLLAHKGYLVFSLEYRLAPQANTSQQLDDVCAGMDCVGSMLVNYNVDFTRIFLAAESAGAYLATYVAAMHDSSKLQDAIGYKASRVVFKAIGLNCGMFYTKAEEGEDNLQGDLLYGIKRNDAKFLRYMDPEHPEIINNLPPIFLSTCKGDFINGNTFRIHKALKAAGKESHMVYYADDRLYHAFMTVQTYHPKTLEMIDKMLAFFEEQAVLDVERKTDKTKESKGEKAFKARVADGSIINQKIWQFVTECNSFSKERLGSTALIDCTREYTYREMFEQWDSYAKVFSALNITGSNKSRVAIAGAITAEPIFCFYGLNMTGAQVSMYSYPDFLPTGKWKTMLKTEKITDLIIQDAMVTPQLWNELKEQKEKLGLRNIIFIHSKMGGPCVGPAEMIFNEFNCHLLKDAEDAVFMDDLIERCKDDIIVYDDSNIDDVALITHTSGTTHGTRKPLPYTDRKVNLSLLGMINDRNNADAGGKNRKKNRVLLAFDLSSLLSINGMVNGTLCNGGSVVLTFFGFLHPKYIRAVEYYRATVLPAAGFMIDQWMKLDDAKKYDLSSLDAIGVGGSYISPEKLQSYRRFLNKLGFDGLLVSAYGMSETGAEQIIVPFDRTDDILGYPKNKENYRIKDENDGKFYTLDDGERTGTMYITSQTMCLNKLDGRELFKYTKIDGKNYICTNDMVRLNKDGSLSYAGRADNFFVNNEGVRFDSGLVTAIMGKQKAIDTCAVAPVLDKRIHDTVPVLYVIPSKGSKNPAEDIRLAIEKVFVAEGALSKTNMPSQFVIVDHIPCNGNGKIDVYRITRERLQGEVYDVIPVKRGKKIVGVKAQHNDDLSSIRAGGLPEGMGESSAFNVFDFFTASSPKSKKNHPIMNLVETFADDPEAGWDMLKKELAKYGLDVDDPKFREDMDRLIVKLMIMMGKESGGITQDYDYED